MSKQEHDFNWVKAELECSIEYEFAKLETLASQSTQEIIGSPRYEKPQMSLEFKSDPPREFSVVRRTFKETKEVRFRLSGCHIVVEDIDHEQLFVVTVGLNDEGECRCRINGEGEHLRWQVIKRALSDLFFSVDS